MNVAEHCLTLKQPHTETDAEYYARLSTTFEFDVVEALLLYDSARTAGYDRDGARTLVLIRFDLLPYEGFVKCYVLSGTTKFALPPMLGSVYGAGSVVALAGSKEPAGDALDARS